MSIKSQILPILPNVSKRSHGSLSLSGSAAPLSCRSSDLDQYVLELWGWGRARGVVGSRGMDFWWKRSGLWPRQRRTSAHLYLLFSPVAQKLFCQKGTFVGIQEDRANTFNWTSKKVETCDNGALCQETILLIRAGKIRKGRLGWRGRVRGAMIMFMLRLFHLP